MSDSGGALTRDILLRVRAQNQSAADFKAITASVNELAASVDKTTEAAARGVVKQKELTEQINQLGKSAGGLKDIRTAIEQFQNMERPINNARAAVERATAKLDEFRTKNAEVVSGVGVLGKELERLENVQRRAQDTLNGQIQKRADYQQIIEKNGFDVKNLAAAEQSLLTVENQIATTTNTLAASRDHYAEILRKTTDATNAQKEAADRAAKAERDQAAALAAVAAEVERLNAARRATGLAGVEAGTKELTDKRDAERKADEDAEKRRVEFLEKARADRMAAVRREVDDNAKAREKQLQDERRVEEERRKAAAESARGATGYLDEARKARMDAVRKEVEENNRIREQGIIAEREQDRRRSLGFLGRLREDYQQARNLRRQDARDAEQSGGTQRRGFLGLRPYEITNLGYQATDVFQGFLAGTSPSVIAAQQGPQIFQIFGLQALKWSPIIVAALGAITVAVGAFSRAQREIASNREFGAAITANVNSLNYTKEQLTALRKEARDMGMSWKDAGEAIKTAMSQNIAQDRIKELLQAAQDAADLGKDTVPDAMKKFAEAFSSGSDGILKLNESYNFLNPTQQRYIRDLIEAGKTEEARKFALQQLTEALRKAAKEGIDPATESVRSLSKAWDDMLVTISKSVPYKVAHDALVELTNDVSSLFKEIDQILKSQNPWNEFWSRFWAVPMDPLKKALTDAFRPTQPPLPGQTTTSATAADAAVPSRFKNPQNLKMEGGDLRELANLIAEASKSLPPGYTVEAISTERLNARTKSGGLSEHGFDRAIDVRIVDAQGKPVPGYMAAGGPLYTQLDEAIKKAAAVSGVPIAIGSTFGDPDAGHYSIRGPEALANQARRGSPVSGGPTSTQTQEGDKLVRQADRERAIQQARTIELDRQARYRKAEAEINEKDIDSESKKKLIADEKAKIDKDLFFEQKQLEEKREKEKIDYARHYNEVVAAGNKAVADALATQNLSWKEQERIRDAAQQKENERLTKIDEQNKAYDSAVKIVDDLERALNGAFGPNMQNRLEGVRTKYADQVKILKEMQQQATLTEKARYDPLIARVQQAEPRAEFQERGKVLEEQAKDAVAARNQLVAANKDLREAGVISIYEEQERNKKAFELTKTAIDDATKSLDEWITKAKEMGVPTIQIEKTKAEIQKLRVESQYVDPLWKGLVKTAEDSFGTRAVEAFDSVAEAIGGAIAKTKEWKDVWVAMRNAALNFFAGILKDIATYIIKAELAKVMSSFLPGLNLGGLTGTATASAATAAATGTASQVGATTGLSTGWSSIFSGAAAVAHAGGVIGVTQLPQRSVPSSWFANAPRFHNGGLAAGEQAAILQTGEEVLTANNPRHVNNYGGGGLPDINIRNVLVADPELVPSHMASARGERVIMNTLTKNAATVRQLVR